MTGVMRSDMAASPIGEQVAVGVGARPRTARTRHLLPRQCSRRRVLRNVGRPAQGPVPHAMMAGESRLGGTATEEWPILSRILSLAVLLPLIAACERTP